MAGKAISRMLNKTIPAVALIGILWTSSCTSAPLGAAPQRPATLTPVPTDVFQAPLADPHEFGGCDFGDNPCASGQNGKTPGYHTGIDYHPNGPVLASGPGVVVLKQINGQQDHGMGNAVILKHFLPDGRLPVYTLYAHLASINSDLVEGQCIDKDHQIGVVGGSGYGKPDYWVVHLHFEFKISAVFGDPKTPDKYWGYIPQTEPDTLLAHWGYLNPNDYIGKERVVRCEALTSELPSKPTPSATATRTRIPPVLTPTLTRIATAPPTLTSSPRPTATPTRSSPPPAVPAAIQPSVRLTGDGKVYVGNSLILDTQQENLGCFGVDRIERSPTNDHFLVLLQCLEGDNEAFLFNADGSGKKHLTGKWDYINYSYAAWSSNGQFIAYERINSCCAPVPASAPPQGLVRYNVETGEKTLLAAQVTLAPFAWAPNDLWIAFLYTASVAQNTPGTLYLVETDSTKLWELENLVPMSACSRLQWDQETPETALRLNCLKTDSTQGASYSINAAPGPSPADRAVPVTQVGGLEGAGQYRVVGVASGDVLNVRSGPGAENPLVGTIPPTGTGIEIIGQGMQAGTTYWVQIHYQDIVGWVNDAYLAEQSSSTATAP